MKHRASRPAPPAVNREGLTLREWIGAATAFGLSVGTFADHRRAWDAGEDPTEWCAAASNIRKGA